MFYNFIEMRKLLYFLYYLLQGVYYYDLYFLLLQCGLKSFRDFIKEEVEAANKKKKKYQTKKNNCMNYMLK